MKTSIKMWSAVRFSAARFYLKFIATKNLVKILWWVIQAAVRMFAFTTKPVRSPEKLGAFHERTYWFNHELEELSSILSEDHDEPRGAFAESLVQASFRAAWRACDRVDHRADRIHDKKLTAPWMLRKAERDIVKRYGGVNQERVLFLVYQPPADPSLYVLCAKENSPEWSSGGFGLRYVVSARRHVYDALIESQRQGLPEYLQPSEAVIEPEGETQRS